MIGSTEPPASIGPRAGGLPPGIGWGLLFTSLLWTGLSIALAINAWHAESLRNVASARSVILIGGACLLLAGIIIATLAVCLMAWPRGRIGRLIAAWLWTAALCIAIGPLSHRQADAHWPWLHALIASVLVAAGWIIAILIRHRRQQDNIAPQGTNGLQAKSG